MGKLTPKMFVQKYAKSAYNIELTTRVPLEVTLAQAALESGWGANAPKYNFFGFTCNDSYPKKQLLTTTEYHSSKNVKYPRILSITWDSSRRMYRYKVKRWFRAYNAADYSFYDYAKLITDNDRYENAFYYINDPKKFAAEIAKAGYATDPSYTTLVNSIIDSISRYL